MLPSTSCAASALVLAALLSVAPAIRAQQVRTLTRITNLPEEHVGAVLSPDGDFVAYRGPDKIAVVRYAGGSEIEVASGRNLGTFVWSHDSLGLYFVDGVELRYVTRGGGLPRLVRTLPEISHVLWAIRQNGADLFGTWLYVRNSGGQTIRETQLFAVATDGMSAPRVLTQSVVVIDGVRVSPDDSKIVYREYDPTPFSRRDYFVANIDGSMPISLTGGAGLGLNPELPAWIDNTSICYARVDRLLSKPVIERLTTTNQTPYPFTFPTSARNVSVAADRRFMAYEGYWPLGATWTPVVMPVRGGGHVFMDTSRVFVFNGAPMLGGVFGDRLVLSGLLESATHSQVYKVELARELLVQPRADTGSFVDVELAVNAGESGIVFLAAAPLPLPVPIVGLAGGFQLDPTTLVTVLTGTGNGQGPLRLQMPIPNVSFLRHRAVYMQGVRLVSPAPAGDCTRLVELPIF